jgi:trigger factor
VASAVIVPEARNVHEAGGALNSSVERLEGNRVRITVVHTDDEVRNAIREAYLRVAHKLRLPGFRPGKAPRPIIDTHVGKDSVLAEALEDLVERAYPTALDELGLRPMERPDTGELDLLVEGEGHTFAAEVDVRPKLTLTSIEDVKVSIPPTTTTDDELDSQIAPLLERFATLEVVEGRGVEIGDFALMSFVGTIDGKTADDLSVDQYLYEFGRGIMPDGFDEGLLGMQAGESRTIEITVPESATNPEYANKTGVFDVQIHEVKMKVLPAFDDAFAEGVGFETAEEMREDLRRRLDGNKAAGRVRSIERAAREMIADRLVGEIPQSLLDDRKNSMLEEFLESIGKQGYTVEDYLAATGVSEQELQIDMTAEATSRLREEFGLEALFDAAGLEYTEEELEAEIAGLAAQEKIASAEMRKRLIENGVMPFLRERLVQRHAIRYLIERVEVVEEEPADVIAQLAALEAEKTAPAKPKKKPAAKKPSKKADDSAKEE